jgi:flagellar basal-body rod modification protein FlgD
MDVNSILTGMNSQATTRAANSQSGSATPDYDTFLKLLMAQLTNQDPTAPMESTDYMAQLAQFSSVEQQTKTNNKLDSLLASSALSQAERFIGRTVTSADGSVSGKVVSVRVFSDGILAKLEGGKEIALEPGVTVA